VAEGQKASAAGPHERLRDVRATMLTRLLVIATDGLTCRALQALVQCHENAASAPLLHTSLWSCSMSSPSSSMASRTYSVRAKRSHSVRVGSSRSWADEQG